MNTIAQLVAVLMADDAQLKRALNEANTGLKATEANAEAAGTVLEAAFTTGAEAATVASAAIQKLVADEAVLAAEAEATGAAMAASAGKAVGAFADIAAAITVISGLTAKMSSDFDAHMTEVINNTTMGVSGLKDMRDAVLALGTSTGTPFEQLADGYMHVTNFGFQAAEAQKILAEANKSAVATGTDASKTAELLANVMHEFSIPVTNASGAMNVLHLAAARGNMTLQQFVDVAGVALGQAANLHVGLTDAGAAMSALTQHGFNASRAATQVADMMVHIVSPTEKATKDIQALSKMTGVDLVHDFSAAGLASKGLYGVLQDVKTATGGNVELINRLIPALRGGQGAISLMGTGADDYRKSLVMLNDALAGKLDPTTEGFNAKMQTSQQKWAQLTNEIKAEFLPIGDKLLVVFQNFEPMIKAGADALAGLLNAFTKLPPSIQEVVLGIGALRILEKVVGMLTGAESVVALLSRTLGGVKAAGLAAGEGLTAVRLGLGALGGPVGIGIALAIAGLVALGTYIDHVDNLEKDLNNTLNETIQKHIDTSQAALDHAKQINVLVDHYEALQKIVNPTKDQVADMHTTLNEISVLAPNLISGYDHTGNAIALMGTNAAQSAQQVAELNRQLALAQNLKINKDASDAADRMSQLQDIMRWEQQTLKSGTASRSSLPTATGSPQDEANQRVLDYLSGKGLVPQATRGREVPLSTSNADYASKLANDLRATTSQYNELLRQTQQLHSQATDVLKSGENNVTGAAGSYGAAIAAAADQVEKGTNGFCERTANNLRKQVTNLFDAFHGSSAMDTLNKLKDAGLVQPYTPGQQLKPGDQLYSTTLGYERGKDGVMHRFGHVETINSAGARVDESGQKNRFGLSNFQYVFDPDRAAATLQGMGYKPGTSTGAPSSNQLNAYEAAQAKAKKDAEKAAKEAEREQKRLQKLFEDTRDKQQEEIDLWGKSGKAAEVAWEIKKGQFEDLKPRQQEQLLRQAQELDNLERLKQLQSAQDKIAGISFSPEKSQAIELAGGIEKWKQMGDGTSAAQKHYLDLSKTLTDVTSQKAASDAMKDLAFNEQLVGQEAKQAAVSAVGGREAWKALSAAEQDTLITEEKHAKALDSLVSMYQDLKASAATAFHGGPQTSLEQANKEIDATLQKIGIAADDPRVANWVAAIRGQASAEDRGASRQFMFDQSRDSDKQLSALKDKLSGIYDPAGQAVRAWERDNADAIARVYSSLDKTTADKAIQGYETQLRMMTETEQKLAGQTQMRDMMADLVKQSMEMKEADPFKAWLDSYKVWDQTANKGNGGFALPKGMNEQDMRQVYDWQQKLQIAQKAAQGIESVLSNAFNNAYQHGFKNFFNDVTTGFKQLMFQLAMQYLMSQFTQLISKTLTGSIAGSGPNMTSVSGGGGFSNLLGGLGTSILGGFLPGLLGGWMGGGGTAPAASTALPTYSQPFPALSQGGDVFAGGSYWVGDGNEPELFTPKQPGTVTPRSKLGMGDNGGNHTHYHVHVSVPDVSQVRRASSVALSEAQGAASREAARRR